MEPSTGHRLIRVAPCDDYGAPHCLRPYPTVCAYKQAAVVIRAAYRASWGGKRAA